MLFRSHYLLTTLSLSARLRRHGGSPVVPTVDLHVPKYEFREEGWYFLD